MISAFRTGEVAGSYAAHNLPHMTTSEQQQAALNALAERISLGIAHCYPEQEFIQGFFAGYSNPQSMVDGLQMAVLLSH